MTINELKAKLNNEGGNLSGVYKITRKSDGRVYIGQSICITDRIIQHINNVHENDSEKIDGAIQKDGWEAFDYEVILALPELNAEQLWLAESINIDRYDSYNNGFNKTKGNHIGKFDHKDFTKKHVVSVDIIKRIRDMYRLTFDNKVILVINLFDQKFIDKLKFDDCTVYYISKYIDDKDELNIYIMEELEKVKDIKFDLIIANPPYGKVGANITKYIIDNIAFDEYINLLPANDYKRNDTHDLYQYVDLDSMVSINDGFADAAVTTHAARITKKKHTYVSWEEFEIENYIDPMLHKYFTENRIRSHYAIDVAQLQFVFKKSPLEILDRAELKKTVVLHCREINHTRLSSKKSDTYKWNMNLVDAAEFVKSHQAGSQTHITFGGPIFNTEIEKKNVTDFYYSTTGSKFLSKLWTSMNVDSSVLFKEWMPKVDWTRSWTVEEILADYGYTPSEIQEVMDDLVNFKGLED